MQQPVIASEVADIRERWAAILSATENRTHKVDKMYGAWNAYDSERCGFEEMLEKLDARLGAEPNVTSTDVQVLQNEVALCKVRLTGRWTCLL